MAAIAIVTTDDMTDLLTVFGAVEERNFGKPVPAPEPKRSRPTVLALRAAAARPVSTYFARDLLLAEDVRKTAREAGLRMVCRCAVPTQRLQTETTISTDISQIIAEQAQ
jgi:hypothetical protein